MEAATIDVTNPYIHGRHLLAAAYESPLAEEDAQYFGPGLAAAADRLVEDGRAAQGFRHLVHQPAPGTRPAEIGLRSSSPDQFTIVDEEAGEVIGTQEADSAFSFLHPGAVYLHMGETYLVTSLDVDGRVAMVRRLSDSYYTMPRKESSTEILSEELRDTFGPLTLHLGSVVVNNQVIAFQKKHGAETRRWVPRHSTCPCSTSRPRACGSPSPSTSCPANETSPGCPGLSTHSSTP